MSRNLSEKGDERWERFISLLGDKIRLRGWNRFRGGLDVKGNIVTNVIFRQNGNNIKSYTQFSQPLYLLCDLNCIRIVGDMTGSHSIYTMHQGHEIMFHVSTMLPFSKDNKQQVSTYVLFPTNVRKTSQKLTH